MSKTTKFPAIREEIKRRQAKSKELRKEYTALSGTERQEAWNQKQWFGDNTRSLLLAYAFLRGVPYRVCERHTREEPDNAYWSFKSLEVARVALDLGHEIDRDDVLKWIRTPRTSI